MFITFVLTTDVNIWNIFQFYPKFPEQTMALNIAAAMCTVCMLQFLYHQGVKTGGNNTAAENREEQNFTSFLACTVAAALGLTWLYYPTFYPKLVDYFLGNKPERPHQSFGRSSNHRDMNLRIPASSLERSDRGDRSDETDTAEIRDYLVAAPTSYHRNRPTHYQRRTTTIYTCVSPLVRRTRSGAVYGIWR